MDSYGALVFGFLVQVKTFKPQLVSVKNASLVAELKEALADSDHKPEIIPGEEGIVEVCHFTSLFKVSA